MVYLRSSPVSPSPPQKVTKVDSQNSGSALQCVTHAPHSPSRPSLTGGCIGKGVGSLASSPAHLAIGGARATRACERERRVPPGLGSGGSFSTCGGAEGVWGRSRIRDLEPEGREGLNGEGGTRGQKDARCNCPAMPGAARQVTGVRRPPLMPRVVRLASERATARTDDGVQRRLRV